MTLKVKAEIIRNFLVKTTADGLVKDCKLVFGAKGLEMMHKDENGVVLIQGLLDKSVFGEYEEMTLEVKDTNTLLKALRTFKDNLLNIVRENNMAKIFDENGGFDLALAEQVDCHFDKELPALEFNNTILTKKSMVTGIAERQGIVASETVLVQNANKELVFQVGEQVDHAQVRMPTNCDVEVSAVFDADYFNKLAKNFDAVFDLSIGFEGTPSRFVEKTDKYAITYYLTPQTVQEGASTTTEENTTTEPEPEPESEPTTE